MCVCSARDVTNSISPFLQTLVLMLQTCAMDLGRHLSSLTCCRAIHPAQRPRVPWASTRGCLERRPCPPPHRCVEPGGCTAFPSHSNSNMLTHPARRQARNHGGLGMYEKRFDIDWSVSPSASVPFCCRALILALPALQSAQLRILAPAPHLGGPVAMLLRTGTPPGPRAVD